MNKYQKIAFGGFILMLFALAVTALQGQQALMALTVFGFMVALATLQTTWKVIYTGIETIGLMLSTTGHGVGSLGDIVLDWTMKRRGRTIIKRYKSAHRVPTWSELSSEELNVPDFLREQDDNAGVGIFDPQPSA